MKRTLSILLALVLLLCALPMTVSAADSDLADTGADITVNVTFDKSTKTAKVTWSPVPETQHYTVFLYNDSPSGEWLTWTRDIKTVGSGESSCEFGSYYFKTYNNGGMNYKVKVEAWINNDKQVTGEKIFQTGIPFLDTPKVSLSQSGVASWSKVANASFYNVYLYTVSGEMAYYVSTSATDENFPSAFLPGQSYYVSMYAGAGNESEYRDSAFAQSNTITMSGTFPSITGISWSGTTLKWNAEERAAEYRLQLKKLDTDKNSSTYGQYASVDTVYKTTELQFNFDNLMEYYGNGKYKVSVQALNYRDVIVTSETDSPVLNYPSLKTDPLTGSITLNTTNSTDNMRAGDWVYSIVNTNAPESALHYHWEYKTSVLSIVYNPVPGAEDDYRLMGVSRDMLGRYVRLRVTADGYDGELTSSGSLYYPAKTVTVDGGTASCLGSEGASIKAQPNDTVTLTAEDRSGYTFSGWEVTSGGVTITNPSSATNAYFTMGTEAVAVKANYTQNASSGKSLTGTVTSFLSDTEPVTVALYKADVIGRNGTIVKGALLTSKTVYGNSAAYRFDGLTDSRYFLTVSKKNHVARDYDVILRTSRSLAAQINPIGDIDGNGRITVADAGKINNHIKKLNTLTGYEFDCADADGNGKITVADAGKLNNHIKKKSTLW